MTDDELWLYTLCKKNGIIITDIEIGRLSAFHALLLDWNKKINLVSRKNEDRIWRGHIALSLAMLFKVKFMPNSRILDLGTGGGFPGIPLAILSPDCTFVLLDSTQKKINAVHSMAKSLQLNNLSTVWGRAEDVQSQKPFSHTFDAVVARSVSHLSNLVNWGFPFLKPGKGKNLHGEKLTISTPSLVTFKGSEIEEEEQEAKRLFHGVSFTGIPLTFAGSEEFDSLEKKLMVVTNK